MFYISSLKFSLTDSWCHQDKVLCNGDKNEISSREKEKYIHKLDHEVIYCLTSSLVMTVLTSTDF